MAEMFGALVVFLFVGILTLVAIHVADKVCGE